MIRGSISAFGQTGTMQMPRNQDGSVNYCLECLSKMTIQCAWCGQPIFIGEPITLYSPRQDFQPPEYAVAYRTNPLQLVGCLRWNCAMTGADRAGFWLPGASGNGHVLRVPTPIEALFGAAQPSMVIVGDLGDIDRAAHPTIIPLDKNE